MKLQNICRHILAIGLTSLLLMFSSAGISGPASSANYNITRDVLSSGGGTGSSTNYTVNATIGQSSAIGASNSLNYNVVGGFQAAPSADGPVITGVWPGTATIDETVSVFVFGNGFDLTPGATEVYFNGVRQWIVQVVTEDMLIARVYVTTALFGPVTVTTSAGSAVSTIDFGIPVTGLQITGVWPGTVTEGISTSVFIFGNEFDLAPGATQVYFNDVRQWIVQVVTPDMLIVRTTPTAALAGPVKVTTGAGSVTSSTDLVVVP